MCHSFTHCSFLHFLLKKRPWGRGSLRFVNLFGCSVRGGGWVTLCVCGVRNGACLGRVWCIMSLFRWMRRRSQALFIVVLKQWFWDGLVMSWRSEGRAKITGEGIMVGPIRGKMFPLRPTPRGKMCVNNTPKKEQADAGKGQMNFDEVDFFLERTYKG